jgi:hypothetical protein
VDTQIELFAAENKTLIESRKQHILSATQLVYRDSEQSMVASRIAGHDRRVAVRTRLIRLNDLTLERILQVYQLGLVEFKKSHILIIYYKV